MSKDFRDQLVALETILRLQGVQTRRINPINDNKNLLLTRLFYSPNGKLRQTVCADLIQKTTSQVQNLSEKLQKEGLVDRTLEGGTKAIISITKDGKKYVENMQQYSSSCFDYAYLHGILRPNTEVAEKLLKMLNNLLIEKINTPIEE